MERVHCGTLFILLVSVFAGNAMQQVQLETDSEKSEYIENIQNLLSHTDGSMALVHLLKKTDTPEYMIPTNYQNLLVQYDLYRNGAYRIDNAIIQNIIMRYAHVGENVDDETYKRAMTHITQAEDTDSDQD